MNTATVQLDRTDFGAGAINSTRSRFSAESDWALRENLISFFSLHQGAEDPTIPDVSSELLSGDVEQTCRFVEKLRAAIAGAGPQSEVSGVCHTAALDFADPLCERLRSWSASLVWSLVDDEPRPWRGIFTVQYRRQELFSQSIKLQTATLPRWTPRVVIDRRTIERGDE